MYARHKRHMQQFQCLGINSSLESQCRIRPLHNLSLTRQSTVSHNNLIEAKCLSADIICPATQHVFGRSADVPRLAFTAREIWPRGSLAKGLSLPGNIGRVNVCNRAYRNIQDTGISAAGVDLVDGVDSCQAVEFDVSQDSSAASGMLLPESQTGYKGKGGAVGVS
jgi:hypothetical protein